MNGIAYKTSHIPSAALGETQDSDTADMTLALHPSVHHIMLTSFTVEWNDRMPRKELNERDNNTS